MMKESITGSKEKQRYYYFRFHEDFFNDINIQYLESKPSGCKFLVILLKLYCFATRERGTFKIPTRTSGELDFEALAHMLKFDTGIVMEAWHYITQLGLIETFVEVDYAIIKAPKLEGMIGASSKDADRKRLEREEQKKLLTVGSSEENDSEPIIEVGLFKNIGITQKQYKALKDTYGNYQSLIDKASTFKRNGRIGDASDYEAILNIAEADGILKKEGDEDNDVPTGIYNNVVLTKDEWERIKRKYVKAKELVDHISTQIHIYDYNMPSHYGFAMKCGKDDHWLTVAEQKKKNEMKEKNKRKEDELCKQLEEEMNAESEANFEKKKKELGFETDEEYIEYTKKKIQDMFSGGKH